MYYDALTARAVRDELRDRVIDGRVQRVLVLGPLSVGLEIYAGQERHYLLASAAPGDARTHLTSQKLRQSDDPPSPLVLLLRKRVRGARLVDVVQPPWERILRLDFVRDHPQEGALASTLILEIMGRHSNIILVDEDEAVLDSAKRVTPEMTRYRTILPRRAYRPPPPQRKLAPDRVTPEALERMIAEAGPDAPVWRILVSGIAAVSPLLALEAAHRALGDARARAGQVDSLQALLGPLREILEDAEAGRWRPTLALEDGEPAAFAPYELTQYPETEARPSISLALEEFHASSARVGTYEARKRPLRAAIEAGRERLRRKRRSLERALPAEGEVERLRASGEWILAMASRIEPRQEELIAGDGATRIRLDPKATPARNAERCFRDYRSARAAAEEVPALIQETEAEGRFLDQIELDLDLAEDQIGIQEVRDELGEAGYLGARRGRSRGSQGRRLLAIESGDGFRILVGRSARENEEITFRRAGGDDLWLHARGVPGAHVVVLTGGREPPQGTIQQAAGLAAHFSSAREAGRVEVDCTRRRHVKKIPGGRPGMVTYRNENTIRVAPTPPPSGIMRPRDLRSPPGPSG